MEQREEIYPSFVLSIPEQLGGGTINESEYVPTAGTTLLVDEMFGLQGVHLRLQSGSLLTRIKNSDYDYLADIIDEGLGHELMKAFHTADTLMSDQYDIAEALRLTEPTAILIEANLRLNKEPTAEEDDFLVKRSSLGKLQEAISTELGYSYRQDEEAEARLRFKTEEPSDGTYEIEDDVISAVDAANLDAIREARLRQGDEKMIGSMTLRIVDGFDPDVIAFYEGEISRIPFYKISLAHTLASGDAIDEISRSSLSGRLSALATTARNREFAWSGRQIELELPWHSVVAGGGVSQN